MDVYFYVLIITVLLALIDDYLYKFSFFDMPKFLSALTIALPMSIIAGLRNWNIGTDVHIYGYGEFNIATAATSLHTYIQSISTHYRTEILYSVLNFVVSRFTNNVNIFLFVLSLITVIPFCLGCILFRKKFNIPVWIQVTIFWGLFYGNSLNLMRQSVAIAFVYLAVAMLMCNEKWNNVSFFILSAVAFGFHRTAFMSIIIWMIYQYINKLSGKAKLSFQIVSGALLIAFGANLGLLVMSKALNTSSLAIKYKQYIDGSNWLAQTSYGWTRILMLSALPLMLLIILLVYRKYIKNQADQKYILFLTLILVVDLVTQISAFSGKVLLRLGLYFAIFECITAPLAFKLLLEKKSRFLGYILVAMYMIFVFYSVTKSGSGEIYPYQWIFS